jgi:hypothetical protein
MLHTKFHSTTEKTTLRYARQFAVTSKRGILTIQMEYLVQWCPPLALWRSFHLLLHWYHDLPPALCSRVSSHLSHVGSMVRTVILVTAKQRPATVVDREVSYVAAYNRGQHLRPDGSMILLVLFVAFRTQPDRHSKSLHSNNSSLFRPEPQCAGSFWACLSDVTLIPIYLASFMMAPSNLASVTKGLQLWLRTCTTTFQERLPQACGRGVQSARIDSAEVRLATLPFPRKRRVPRKCSTISTVHLEVTPCRTSTPAKSMLTYSLPTGYSLNCLAGPEGICGRKVRLICVHKRPSRKYFRVFQRRAYFEQMNFRLTMLLRVWNMICGGNVPVNLRVKDVA